MARSLYAAPTVMSTRVAEWCVINTWPNWTPFFLPEVVHPFKHTNAMIFGGNWVVGCPTCKSVVQFTDISDKRFFCTICFNAVIDNQWLRVVWPDNYRDIEEPLLVRPNPATRNWLPYETVEQLWTENLSNGIPDTRKPMLSAAWLECLDEFKELERTQDPSTLSTSRVLALESGAA